jgi:ABC-type Fe3+-hydroxamate transport system substrate-binding protein
MAVTDALGRTLALAAAPRRIVSLVPSWSELLFALGASVLVALVFGLVPAL